MGMKIQEGKWTLEDKLALPWEWTMIFFTNLHTNSFPLPPFMTNYQTSRKSMSKLIIKGCQIGRESEPFEKHSESGRNNLVALPS